MLLLRAVIFASILLLAFSFPTNSWKSISFSLTNQQIDNTIIDFDGGNVFVYVLILSTDNLTLKLHYYKVNTSPPTQLAFKTYTFTNAISKPNIIPLKTKALLSYDVSSTSTSYLVQLAKSNLLVETNTTTAKRQKGVYIREYDYLISQRQSERVISQPEVGGGTVKATYSMGSTPETNMFLYTNALTKMFTVYSDVNDLLIRNLNSDVNTFASAYNSPVVEPLIAANPGYFCACFNADQTILYIYDNERYLVGYDLAQGMITIDDFVGIVGVKNCFFDVSQNSVVLVKNSNNMKEVDISTLAITTHSNTYQSFSIQRTGTYAAMHQGNTLDIFMVNSVSCSNGFFFDAPTNACQACPAGCSLCSNSTFCSSCLSGYILSASLCVPNCPNNCLSCSSPAVCTNCATTYFINALSLCGSCPSNCDVYSGASVCTTCTTNYNLNGGNLCDPICPSNCLLCTTPTVCTSCSTGFMVDGTNLCTSCPSNCDACSSPSVCTTCSPNYNLNAGNLCDLMCPSNCLNCTTPTACTSCMTGFMVDVITSLCVSCPSNCDICSNPSICTACSTNYILNGGNLCDPVCPSNCLTCTTPSVCTSCTTGFMVNPMTNLCVSCPSNCDICSSVSVCTTCSANYNLNAGNLCDPVCPSNCLTCTTPNFCTSCSTGFMVNSVTNLCVSCPSNCDVCSSPSTCTTCSINYLLNGGNLCDPVCSSNCLTCTSPITCTSCTTGFMVDPSTNLCVSCPSNCDVCSSPSVCSTCSTNYNINGGNLCDPICSSNCLTCTIPNTCTSCASTFFLNVSTNLCDQCPSNCNTCSNSTICSVCASSYTLNASSLCNLNPISNNSEVIFFQELIGDLLANEGLAFANKVPGGRRALPFLCFLVNIDELWLYQYHERNYGETMKNLFENIQKLENQKWKILEDETTEVVYQKLGTSKKQVYQFIDTKSNYTGAKFKQMEGRGETFLPACYEFLTFNLIFVLVAFLILRCGHNLLKKYKVSKLLRPFSLMVYLTPLLLDGNLQYFFFLLFSQTSLSFSLNPRDKFLNVLNYMFYFVIILFSVVSCFWAYWQSRRLANYLLDNWRTKLYGLLAYSLTNTVRMLVLGAFHSLLRSHPAQLPLLLSTEVIYIAFLIFCMGYWRAHRVAFKIWFTVLFSLLRMVIQTLMIFQQSFRDLQGKVEIKLEVMFGFLLTIYFFTIYAATIWEILYQIIEVFKPVTKAEGDEKQKQQNKKQKQIIKTQEKSDKKDKIIKICSNKSPNKSKNKSCLKKKKEEQKELKKNSKSKSQKKKKEGDKKQQPASFVKKNKEGKQTAQLVRFNQQIAEKTFPQEKAKTPSKKKYLWTIRQVQGQ